MISATSGGGGDDISVKAEPRSGQNTSAGLRSQLHGRNPKETTIHKFTSSKVDLDQLRSLRKMKLTRASLLVACLRSPGSGWLRDSRSNSGAGRCSTSGADSRFPVQRVQRERCLWPAIRSRRSPVKDLRPNAAGLLREPRLRGFEFFGSPFQRLQLRRGPANRKR